MAGNAAASTQKTDRKIRAKGITVRCEWDRIVVKSAVDQLVKGLCAWLCRALLMAAARPQHGRILFASCCAGWCGSGA